MKYKIFLVLLVIIGSLGFVLRLYKFSNPIADWHSWRQADTAAVARNFLKFGIDPLRPRYDDISNIQSGKDNPSGWRMVEFPLYQLIAVSFGRVLIGVPIESALRIVTILASTVSIFLIGVLGGQLFSRKTGLYAALFFAILPYSIYYGRTILPEPFMVAVSLVSLTCAVIAKKIYGTKKIVALILSAIFAALALLVKPFAVFLLIPLPYLFLMSLGISWRFVFVSFISLIIAIGPLVLWREWIAQFPEGIPVFLWLFNEGNIRFKGAWFYWLFAERISKLLLGYWGVGILIVGLVRKREPKEGFTPVLLLLGGILYVVIIARGNVQHDYYQILLLPILSLYFAKGMEWFFTPPKEWNLWISRIAAGIVMCFLLSFSWYNIRGYYWINHPEIIEAGKKADEILPKDAKVIASYNGDTTFLYQTNRQGWPLGFEIEKKILSGAKYYITVSPTDEDGETRDLATRYTVLVRNDRYAIIDLTKPKP